MPDATVSVAPSPPPPSPQPSPAVAPVKPSWLTRAEAVGTWVKVHVFPVVAGIFLAGFHLAAAIFHGLAAAVVWTIEQVDSKSPPPTSPKGWINGIDILAALKDATAGGSLWSILGALASMIALAAAHGLALAVPLFIPSAIAAAIVICPIKFLINILKRKNGGVDPFEAATVEKVPG